MSPGLCNVPIQSGSTFGVGGNRRKVTGRVLGKSQEQVKLMLNEKAAPEHFPETRFSQSVLHSIVTIFTII